MTEVWKDITGFEGYYQISNTGKIKSVARYVKHSKGGLAFKKERIIKQVDNGNGYWYCSLWRNNIGDGVLVHRLIAIHFIPNPENKEFINHIDGVKSNNTIDNLEWCNKSENAIHAYSIGLSTKRLYGDGPKAKKVLNIETGEITTSIKELAERIGVSYYSLRNQLTGRTPNASRYILAPCE